MSRMSDSELIQVWSSQSAGEIANKPGGRLLLPATGTVTFSALRQVPSYTLTQYKCSLTVIVWYCLMVIFLIWMMNHISCDYDCCCIVSGSRSARCSWKLSTISWRNFTPALRHLSYIAEVSVCVCLCMFVWGCVYVCLHMSVCLCVQWHWKQARIGMASIPFPPFPSPFFSLPPVRFLSLLP